MAPRGSSKALSVEHEDYIANLYGGQRSSSSGAADNDAGDVRVSNADDHSLIECKMKGSPAKPLKKIPTILKQFEKIAEEAYEEGRTPALALRFYAPDNPLANTFGWVDLIVRKADEDSCRSWTSLA